MRIDAIEPVASNRDALILDTGERLIMYKGELRLLKIKGVGDLSEETYRQIKESVLPKRAKLRAMNLLKTRDYTEYKLRLKLTEGGYPSDIVDQALDYVKQYGYINDSHYAVSFIEQERKRLNPKIIRSKLISKGISSNTIDDAFAAVYGNLDGESDKTDELSVIHHTLVKKGFTGSETYEERQKLLGYFYRKGFSMDLVYSAMESFTV
ncbi:MAG: recombination regulator RecX [Lachnospiraceae bacterium]|nr:recombination regulator RecX [Lachnospiraceae bacterium]